jgi:hypothetical protein
MKERKLTELDSVIELDSANEYIKQQMKDNAAFNQGFNFGRQSAFSGLCIQIQKFDSVYKTNEFLKTIPKENIIKIEPLENNTYLVTYSEEMK